MKPFGDLTKAARFRRLKTLARQALHDYDLADASLVPLQYTLNATWSVCCARDAASGNRLHSGSNASPDGVLVHCAPWAAKDVGRLLPLAAQTFP